MMTWCTVNCGRWLMYEDDAYEPDCIEEAETTAIRRGLSDAALSHLTNMRTLRLQGCQCVTDVGLCELLQRSPDLRVLDLAMCTRVTDATLHVLGAACPQIRRIRLARCVPDSEWPASHGPTVSADGLRALVDGCRSLERLSLYGQRTLLEDARTKEMVRELRSRGVQVKASLSANDDEMICAL